MAITINTGIISGPNDLIDRGGQGDIIIQVMLDQYNKPIISYKKINSVILQNKDIILFATKESIGKPSGPFPKRIYTDDLIAFNNNQNESPYIKIFKTTARNIGDRGIAPDALIRCIQCLSEDEYNKLYKGLESQKGRVWCIVKFRDTPSYEGYYANCNNLVKAFLSERINAQTSDTHYVERNLYNWDYLFLTSVRQKGFYYRSGFYDIVGGKIKPKYVNHAGGSQAPYQYIGVNNSNSGISYSEIKQSKSELSSYSEIWSLELDNSDPDSPAYMKLVSSGGGSSQDDSYDSDIIYPDISNSIQDNIIPAFELDYTKGAMNLSSNYITDFSPWELKFEGFSGYTEIVNQEELQKKKLDIFHRDIFNGEINKQVYIPVIKGSTQDCNLEEFLSAMDNLMNRADMSIDIRLKPSIKLIIYIDKGKSTQRTVNMQTYFLNEYENLKGKATFVYYEYNSEKDEWIENPAIDFKSFIAASINPLKNSVVESESYTYSVDLLLEQEKEILNLYSLELFEAYTRGHDFIQENYTTVRAEERDPNNSEENSRIMNYEDNYFAYKYSGRNIDITAQGQNTITLSNSTSEKVKDITIAITHSSDLLLESDVTLGESYGENKYFIEAIKAPIYEQLEKDSEGVIKNPIKKETGEYLYKDSFKVTDYLDPDNGGFDPKIWTDEDISVVTGTIDLLQCEYYHPTDATYQNKWCDCSYGAGTSNKECLYQKLGYCPYRFESEKHPRRIRSLQQSKSNRFNLIQELSTVFEIYPYFYIEHDERGKIILNENGDMKKHVFYMTEKGNEKNLGFRYEKNLNSVSRTLDSSSITTKLYVENVDSSYSPTGLNSIQTATDNIGKTSYILDFSYYVDMGMIEAERIQRDIYGIEKNDFAFLPRIGAYNSQYDKYSNLIITMTGETLVELQAQNEVSVTGITTALEERKKIAQTMYQFKTTKIENNLGSVVQSYTTSDTYKNYIMKYREQSSILWGLVEDLFYSNNYFSMPILKSENNEKKIYHFQSVKYGEPITNASGWQIIYNNNYNKYCKGELFWRLVMEGFENESYIPPFNKWIDFKEQIVDPMLYEINGNLGKYKSLYNEVKYWKNKRAEVLEKINKLSEEFYKKYEPYIKEGTFSDSNYLTDNKYYWAGVQVLSDSCAPKLSYNFSVIDLSPLDDDYTFELADSTFVEDIDFFGINKITGLPNRQKVIINEITYDLDNPSQNSIGVINYTSNFADLFESITASVQSLTFNENIYKRASNFTAKQYVDTDSLQGTLDIGDLTLLDTPKDNIVIDDNGTEGNDINNTASQYRITGQGVEFSTDGGETWDIGVGPKGINMDYAKFGSLDASKIQIVDGNYIYFLWDKDGINSYRNPATSAAGLVDFARFNRYGLSLIENNNVRLRAGYEYRSNANGVNETGNYAKELPLTNQNIGFYLYNDQGQAIFKTETRSNYAEDNNSDYSARLSLTGEMFVTNKILDSDDIYAEDVSADEVYEYSEEWHFNSEMVKTFSEYNRYFTSQSIIQEMITNSRTAFLRYNNDSGIGDSFYNSYFSIDVVQGPSAQENSLIYEEQQGSSPVTYQYVLTPVNIRYIDVPFNTQGDAIQPKTFNSLSIIKANFYSNNLLTFVKTTFTAEEVLSWFINNDFERDGLPQIIDSSSLQDILNCDIEITQSDDDVYNIAVRESLPGEAVELPVTNADIGNILTEGETNSIPTVETEATLKTTYNVESTLIEYTKENGDNETVNLYRLEDGSYWKNKEDTGEVIVNSNSNFKNAEVGIFINNKKALNVNDSSDKTNSSDQTISKENSDEQNAMAQEAILSGAERTFMISAISASKGDVSYNNILSVLKNGVLYMGGTVTDFYGKPLNISGLQYMPDEVRISEPSIVMSRNGQIWCDWSSFFLAFKQDGVYQYTTFSLMDFVSSISNWSQSASGGSKGTARVAGWYIDENKAGTI